MSTKNNLVLDLSIFGAFLVIANPRLTGTTIHEWLGIALVAGIVTHLLSHWQWIIKVGGEFFKKLIHQSRLNFVVDTLFFISMTASFLSGILISRSVLPLLGIQFNPGQGWRQIHSLVSDTSVIALGVHIAIHWNWVTVNFGRYIASPMRGLFQRQPAPSGSLAIQPVRIDEDK